MLETSLERVHQGPAIKEQFPGTDETVLTLNGRQYKFTLEPRQPRMGTGRTMLGLQKDSQTPYRVSGAVP